MRHSGENSIRLANISPRSIDLTVSDNQGKPHLTYDHSQRPSSDDDSEAGPVGVGSGNQAEATVLSFAERVDEGVRHTCYLAKPVGLTQRDSLERLLSHSRHHDLMLGV